MCACMDANVMLVWVQCSRHDMHMHVQMHMNAMHDDMNAMHDDMYDKWSA